MNRLFLLLKGALVIALTGLGLGVISQASYTTIAPGQWSDFDIWSLDGETACYCAPPAKLTNTEVQIRHRISSLTDISIGAESNILIEVPGALDMPAASMNVEDGALMAYGRLMVQQLDICDGARATISHPGVVGTRFEVNGSLDLLFSGNDTFLVKSATVHINHGADFDLHNATLLLNEGDLHNDSRIDINNSKIITTIGDVRNHGTLAFANACVTTAEGDFYNTGTLTGEGAIDVASTFVSDQGEINGIAWCAKEWYTNASEPACAEAAVICGNIGKQQPEAFHLVQLQTKIIPDGVELSWSIDGEGSVQLYEIQKATSNYMFFPIAWIDPSEEQQYHKQYSCIDNNPAYEVIYYRIAVWESDGETKYSNIVQVGKEIARPPSI